MHSFDTRRQIVASIETNVSEYSVYLLRCCDGSYYTGIATDVARRISEHEDSPKGAKYLRGKGPLTLVFQREIGNRSLAARVECRVKRLPKAVKADSEHLPRRIDEILAALSGD